MTRGELMQEARNRMMESVGMGRLLKKQLVWAIKKHSKKKK